MPTRILLVCTANQCRSPMAEALLRRRLAEREEAFEVTSAGLLPGGAPATDEAIKAMAAEGLDISGHRSRQVDPPLLAESDLVVTMTRQHVIDLAVEVPESWPRIFQVVDLLHRAEQHGARAETETFPDWVAALGEGRARTDLLKARLSDDVADPVGQSAGVYKRTRDQLDRLMTRLAELV